MGCEVKTVGFSLNEGSLEMNIAFLCARQNNPVKSLFSIFILRDKAIKAHKGQVICLSSHK